MKKMYTFFLTAFLLGSTAFAQNMDGIVQNYFGKHTEKSETGFSSQDVSEWRVTDIVPSLNPQIQHVYVQQMFQGVPIQNGTYKLTVKNGEVTWEINQFISDLGAKASVTQASLTPESAIMSVVNAHQISTPSNLNSTQKSKDVFVYENSGISIEPISVEKVYLYQDSTLHLTWKVSIYPLDGEHWWSVNVDATSGTILRTEDWVISCSFGTPDHSNHGHDATVAEESIEMGPVAYSMTAVDAALVGGGTYNVYPLGIESPNHGNRVLVSDPANATASPFGWHDTNGSAGAEFTTTVGNNVTAQDDTNGNNGTGSRPNGGSSLNFDFPLNLNNAPSTFLPAATTNLFYWNNIMHDVWYQYGFNEASGNFQENNYGNGGAGSDSVNADAQDGSGTNNANFATPPDGSNPRMQMFLFTNPTRDGDLDNVIIAHEYGHGISTRLVGGPGTNALGGSEQMGEGWSDWFGLVMTIRPGDDRNTARGVGTYAIGQPTTGAGIRPTRYSTDLAVNGTDYGDIGGLAVPHGVGYGFATILWDMTWDLIDLEGYDANQYTGTGGNNIAMALVTEGLKNTANNPGYVSGRDGILQADQDLYGGQYNCLIWDAFARRGVGVDAVENSNGGTNTNTDQVISFTSGCAGPPPPATCNSTVSSFPYNEGFENTLGAWSQDTSDDIDWTINSGGTPSNSTGPSAANEGTFYIYMEVSGDGAGFPNKTAILNSPCFNLTGVNAPSASFSYQMTGNAVGTVRLEAREDGSQTWTEIWSQSGDQGAAWIDQNVSLAAYSGTVQLRFRGTSAASWQGDIAIDGFSVEGAQAGDTQAPTVPTNLAVTGVTTSSVALSWTASTDNVGVTAYDVFQGSSNLGEVTGTTANVTGLAEGTTYQFSVRAKDAAGNVSANSNTVSATTSTTPPPTGGCSGGVDTLPYGESFEANLGLWTQAGGDDLNWTRDSGGTPSNNTGPSSGSDGSFYMYVEASGNGTGFPNKRAILNSPCFDLSAQTEASFIFDYHMFGSTDAGRVDLEASTDDGATWTSIWNQTGNQGNQWNNVTIDLAAYLGGSVQLRFNRITGGTWQSDVAIDNTRVVAGNGNDPNPPSGYCASNGQNNSEEFISRVQIGSIDNSSGAGAGGYQDFTNLSTDLSGSASITITPTWTGTVYNEAYAVFIDWNRDGDFADAGETAFSQSPTQATSISGTITVPSGAAQGLTRMRVSMKYNAAPTSCESFNFGEVEDYLVNVSSSANFGPTTPAGNELSENPAFDFSIFPNPVTRGELNVSVIGAEAQNLTIYNMLGQVVRKGAFTETVDVSKLDAGIYVLEIEVEGSKMIKRFIKK
ncbi:M36 family metallopeptidase [Dokdonia pacifica]|uniref:Por secretion system C-terminal sorting domain-containing protein n=3 Tax=Dokdonia pacifica TaxID=1627892 RepID=A0A238WD84_9FLAO|nr:M36 family metallopeptidase [Dokdonia pacifica]SNR44532.1 Por secretion system C-terminal sorting domain-containing protein [Dokdonia pacifica]